MTKICVTLRTDDDGFFGTDPDNIDTIDMDQSYANYQSQVTDAIRRAYPDAEIEFSRQPYSGSSILVHGTEAPDIAQQIEAIDACIYDQGTFWVKK